MESLIHWSSSNGYVLLAFPFTSGWYFMIMMFCFLEGKWIEIIYKSVHIFFHLTILLLFSFPFPFRHTTLGLHTVSVASKLATQRDWSQHTPTTSESSNQLPWHGSQIPSWHCCTVKICSLRRLRLHSLPGVPIDWELMTSLHYVPQQEQDL